MRTGIIVENVSSFSKKEYSRKEFCRWQLVSQDIREHFRNASLLENRNISAEHGIGRVNL